MARAVARSAAVKGPNAFRTISEAAEAVGAPQHVLRFWETKFAFVTPVKRAGGRRFYRPQDVELLKAIRRLLHEDGLTIRGVQRLHREQGLRGLLGNDAPMETSEAAPPGSGLTRILAELERARSRLDAALAG
ncbi:MerR family transcriptional regulator [Brevundimonas sp. VNH65]|uniref:MerR family transcriptional regulator n=1 Tax=Brevundimonas sp. VNH65 TaxID=3400917 RepID=UPI003C1180F7